MVPHPFEVDRHRPDRGDHAQILRHRLLGRDQAQAAVLEFEVQGVDDVVGGDHRLRLLDAARLERVDRALHRRIDEPPHPEEIVLQLPQVAIEGIAGADLIARVDHPNRPVM